MINKERNVRFNITISKKQYEWLRDFSNKKHLRISQLISWLLAKKTKDVIDTLNLNTQPQEEVNKLENEEIVTDEELASLLTSLDKMKKKD